MPVFSLTGKTDFPPPSRAGPAGLLALGGDLSPQRLLRAYGRGIFPWYEEGQPILWWSPDPRFVLFPAEIHVARSLRKILDKNIFRLSFDRAFGEVIAGCARPRFGQGGTWITPEMRRAFITMHRLGYAHSIEAWHGGQLAGGLYGISLGRCFFAESMFHNEANASKAALIALALFLRKMEFVLIDCQLHSPHLAAWGARPIPRRQYLEWLRGGLSSKTLRGNWQKLFSLQETYFHYDFNRSLSD
ncbi:MAG: leucyl/phenylalanyl-tRNA--protein transferase [Candidatus Aminicenantes bacterium]|nr:leucyl/phenylalanyl-tRNA--protein transferase [Candidatus Aminicenantes bacterium]